MPTTPADALDGEPGGEPVAASTPEGAVDARLLELLVCPVSKASLLYDAAKGELISRQARLAYPIRDGIAIMLPGEARELDDADLRKLGKA